MYNNSSQRIADGNAFQSGDSILDFVKRDFVKPSVMSLGVWSMALGLRQRI